MVEQNVIIREKLWASQEEIIKFLDNHLRDLGRDDQLPDIGFPIQGFTTKFGSSPHEMMRLREEYAIQRRPGVIEEDTFWDNHRWIKICIHNEGGPFGHREFYGGHVELFAVMGCKTQTDVEIVCGWSLYRPYWEWVAKRLQKNFGRPKIIPIRGKVIFAGSPDDFGSYFVKQVMHQNNPPLRGLLVGVIENRNPCVYWTDSKDDVENRQIRVLFEPSGGETLLTICAFDDDWSRLSWWWELLFRRMTNEGRVTVITPWDLKEKSGRPSSDEDNPATADATGIMKRGPKSLSDEEKLVLVQEWYKVEGKETQVHYCFRKGIAVSTLGLYQRQLRARRLLPPHKK